MEISSRGRSVSTSDSDDVVNDRLYDANGFSWKIVLHNAEVRGSVDGERPSCLRGYRSCLIISSDFHGKAHVVS